MTGYLPRIHLRSSEIWLLSGFTAGAEQGGTKSNTILSA